ncbi:hypothetical protein ATANTOWER_027797 [Ataeniobius toweri]|uniref:Uncharacterized protein n=1 Tax=Ataeniobius toweri TaxID=208326 RepID=A0ABU7BIY2_9TELE|nr:hypothetical protein [Ataeniobius toweri]
MRTSKSRHVTSPVTVRCRGPTLDPGLGLGLIGERLVTGLLLVGPCWAKPEQEMQGQPPVGPPPAGGTMTDQCKEDRAADEGGDLDDPISGCLGWLKGRGMSPLWG